MERVKASDFLEWVSADAQGIDAEAVAQRFNELIAVINAQGEDIERLKRIPSCPCAGYA